jgi:hypothetical protein
MRLADELADGVSTDRAGEEVPLAAVAGLALEVAELARLLDPLGEGLDAEALAALDEGVDQRLRLGICWRCR